MTEQYNIVFTDQNGSVTNTEGPVSLEVAVARVLQCMKRFGHEFKKDSDIELKVRKGEPVFDKNRLGFQILYARPVPNPLGLQLQHTLDQVNAAIVRVECLTRANWHDKDQMVEARRQLRQEAETLESLTNTIRTALGLAVVKAV